MQDETAAPVLPEPTALLPDESGTPPPDAPFPVSSLPPLLPTRTVRELFAATLHHYRENLRQYLLLAALIVVPVTVCTTWLTLYAMDLNRQYSIEGFFGDASALQRQVWLSVWLSFGLSAILLVQAVFLNGIVTVITSERQFNQRLTLRDAWRIFSQRATRLAWSYVLFSLFIGLLFVLGVFTWVCLVGIVITALTGYLSITVSAQLVPVVMLEKQSASPAITRAHRLAKVRFWRMIAFNVLLALIPLALSFGVGVIVGFLAPETVPQQATGSILLQSGISGLLSIFTAPLLPIGMTLFYYDTRLRLEGLDQALQMGGPDARPAQVPGTAAVNGGAIFSGRDFLNILLLVVIGFGLTLLTGLALGSILNTILPVPAPGLISV